jgi:hypothetical protein
MPSLSPHSFSVKHGLAKHRLTRLGQAIILGLGSALLFTGCGGDSPTTRTNNDNPVIPEATYKLTVTSPVKLKNALVRIIDTTTGKEIDQKTIIDGSETSFDIKASYANGGRILIAEISGKDNTSLYFDPARGEMASLNMPLHGIFGMLPVESSTIVSPFTEIAYQRALVRANNLDFINPVLSKIDLTSLAYANREIFNTFRVDPVKLVPAVGSLSDFNKFIINTKDVIDPPNTTSEYLNIFYAAGHIKLQQIENSEDTTPLLTFAKRAGVDMRDGSLDGMTLAGGGEDGTVFLKDPIIAQQIVNSDPTFNHRLDKAELKAQLAITQQAARESYATRLGGAEDDANKDKLGGAMARLFATLSNPDAQGKNYFSRVDFITGRDLSINDNMPPILQPRSFGAGNYKYAFGLGNLKLTKDVQKIRNLECNQIDFSDPRAGDKDYTGVITQNIDCEIGTNADGILGNYNAVENLVGTYTGDNQCKLTIYFNGDIQLTNGQKTVSSSINRDESDSIIRLQANTQDYLLNVASAERNPPEFVQIRVTNQNVVSATAGIVNDIKAKPFPGESGLDREDLVCKNFKPVFIKP